MATQSIDRNPAHFRIFTSRVVFSDEGLNLRSHCILTSDGCETRGFGAASCFKDITSMLGCDASEFGCAFASG
jgi:hypothetical protein